jgi:Dolichyl-phosphate-mannose-protein mannosyltransferase
VALPLKSRLVAFVSSLALILIMAFATRAAFAWDQERKIPRDALAVVPFAQETGNIAYALANGQGFSSPFRNNTGPTAWLVPVYPVILAGLFRVFGPLTIPSLNAAIFLNILFSTAACVPIFYVGKRVGGPAAGVVAAWCWALLPAAIMLPFEWIWDTSLAALLAALLLWATLCVAESNSWRDWCLYGLLWGFSLLTNAALGALLVPWLAWAGYRVTRRGDRETAPASAAGSSLANGGGRQEKSPGPKPGCHKGWKLPLAAAAIAILCCVPWTVRNFVQFHRLIPLRSNFSFELWSGNNNIFDPHTGNAMARITLYGEVRQYTQLGETGYMQDKWRKATLFIRTHPLLESKLFLGRIIATWLGTQHPIKDFLSADFWLPRVVFLVNALLLAGTVAGVVLLYLRRNLWAFPLAIAPVIFPIVYYVTHTSLRYRHPLDPILVLLTALSATAIFTASAKRQATADSISHAPVPR